MAEAGGIARAVAAAERVFDGKPCPPGWEPPTTDEAAAAVRQLGKLFEEQRGAMKEMLKGARSSGTLLAGDRLQGLAEIVQNADDARASEVCFLLTPSELLASHDGTPVRLEDVLGFATPWLTTKADDAEATGRFGIGLSNLQSLSASFEVHCAPYHFRVGDPSVAPVEPIDMPCQLRKPVWTTLRIPLQPEALEVTDLHEWLDRWDDSALLFLRHVARVTLMDLDAGPARELALAWHRGDEPNPNSGIETMSRRVAESTDGRSWTVYSADVPTPEGVSRANKAKGPTTPIAVALPVDSIETGQIYAGLPVAPMDSPVFANAQFDPLTSRTDLGDTAWNQALVNLVASLWSEAVLDRFERDPQSGWQAVPLPQSGYGENRSRVIGDLEATLLKQARQKVASHLSFAVTGRGRVGLTDLAAEARPLEGVLREDEIARLAGLDATLPHGIRDPAGRWRSVLDDWRSHVAGLPTPVSVERALNLLNDADRPVDATIALVAVALQEGLGERLLKLPSVIAHDGRLLIPPVANSVEAVIAEAAPLAEQLGIATRLHPAHLAPANGAPEVLTWLQKCGALLDGSDDREVVHRIATAGRARRTMAVRLTDQQLSSLRDAFERLKQDDQRELGADVGRAILLESYTYDAHGQKKKGSAHPADAYLPRAIERDQNSFAVAAGKSQRLAWLSDRYAEALRSPEGRGGLGSQKFLRLLGAETAPRLRPHPEMWQRYERDERLGLSRCLANSPGIRTTEMKARGATFTLDDLEYARVGEPARGEASCLPLLFAALTGRSGHGLAQRSVRSS